MLSPPLTNPTIEVPENIAKVSPVVETTNNEIKIILDKREHQLKEYLADSATMQQLALGDIIIGKTAEEPIVIIERKSFADLFASIKDGRYAEQSYRLHGNDFHGHNVVYLLEGMVSTLNEQKRKLLYSCITSIMLFKGFSVMRSSSISETAEIVLVMADKIRRDLQKGKDIYYNPTTITPPLTIPELPYASVGINKVKRENITPKNIGTFILSQIPGINWITAEAIIKQIGDGSSFREFYAPLISSEKGSGLLDGLRNEAGRKISKTAIENIKKYIL
jgi:ERCC4-type nuclease